LGRNRPISLFFRTLERHSFSSIPSKATPFFFPSRQRLKNLLASIVSLLLPQSVSAWFFPTGPFSSHGSRSRSRDFLSARVDTGPSRVTVPSPPLTWRVFSLESSFFFPPRAALPPPTCPFPSLRVNQASLYSHLLF